jgi:hypothetical protein
MRNTVEYFLGLLLLIVCPMFALGQARSRGKADNLKTLINQYSAKTVSDLNKDNGEEYKEYERRIFYSDVDHDGDLDAVVELAFCKAQDCHPITQSSNMAVFLNNHGSYRFVAGKTFIKFNEDNSIEAIGKIRSIKNGQIRVDIYGCEVDDPVCLPKFLYREAYFLKRNRLVRVRS